MRRPGIPDGREDRGPNSIGFIGVPSGAGEDRKGLSAGLLNTSIQLGNAWSLGIVATVVAAATVGGQAAGPEALVEGLRWGLLACVGFAVLAVPVVLFGLRGEEASSKSAL